MRRFTYWFTGGYIATNITGVFSMYSEDRVGAARLVANAVGTAEDLGLSLYTGGDFSVFSSIIRKGGRPSEVTVAFDCAHQPIDATNAFWVCGFDQAGKLVHTQALRLIDLEGGTLADYMAKRFVDFPPAGVNFDLSKSMYVPGPRARNIAGRACYHGEVWIDNESHGLRGSGLAPMLGRMAIVLAMLKWRPDYVFGFMSKALSFKGFGLKEGYMHTEPSSLRLYQKDVDQFLEGYMVWMAVEDLIHLIKTAMFEIPEMLINEDLIVAFEKRATPDLELASLH
jgi:hypothetical protein